MISFNEASRIKVQVNEYRAFYNGVRLTISAKTSYEASREAIARLRIPSKRIGQLAIVLVGPTGS